MDHGYNEVPRQQPNAADPVVRHTDSPANIDGQPARKAGDGLDRVVSSPTPVARFSPPRSVRTKRDTYRHRDAGEDQESIRERKRI